MSRFCWEETKFRSLFESATALNCYFPVVFSILKPALSGAFKSFSVALFCLGNGLLRNFVVGQARGFILDNNFHSLGFNCPANLICSLLNFLFAYHIPPRQPKPYLKNQGKYNGKKPDVASNLLTYQSLWKQTRWPTWFQRWQLLKWTWNQLDQQASWVLLVLTLESFSSVMKKNQTFKWQTETIKQLRIVEVQKQNTECFDGCNSRPHGNWKKEALISGKRLRPHRYLKKGTFLDNTVYSW